MRSTLRRLFSVAPLVLFAVSSPAIAADPTDAHRWHLPHRGATLLAQDAVGPVHAEWNLLGESVNLAKSRLADWGIRFDVDLDFFNQYATRVAMGRKNFASFSWRVMGDWQAFDVSEATSAAWLGKGFLAWNAFGTEGLDYDAVEQTLTGNVASVNVLNATIFDQGAVLDELYWKQVAWGGKLILLGGMIDMLYHFDTNRVANDGYSQFFSYSLQNNPSIPGPLYGGFGGVVRGNLSEDVYVMFGVGDSSVEKDLAPWKTVDNDSWYQLLEWGLSPDVPVLGKGQYRLTLWHNHLFGEDGFGVALNFDQELGHEDVVAFFRFGVGDKDVTPVKTFVSGGLAYEAPFGREHDVAAIGVAWSRPSPLSGLRDETLVELFYRIEVVKAVSISPDLQVVFDPSNNPGDDVVFVPGVRLHVKF